MPRADEPWKATARALVLYNVTGEWRYAIYSDVGATDGALDDLPGTAAPEQAQAALLARTAEVTGHRYSAVWEARDPHWWAADLSMVDP